MYHLVVRYIYLEFDYSRLLFFFSMHRGRDAASYEQFRQDLSSVFTDLNELMSSRIADVTVQVGAYIVL